MTVYEHCKNYLNGRRKSLLGILVSVGTLIGMISGVVLWMESRYAHSDEVAKDLDSVVQTIQELRCQMIRDQLNDLAAKEQYSDLTEYDHVTQQSMIRKWRESCNGGFNQ